MSKKRKKSQPQRFKKTDTSFKINSKQREKHFAILKKVGHQTGCREAFQLLSKDEKNKIFIRKPYFGPLKVQKGQNIPAEPLEFFTNYVTDFYSIPNGGLKPQGSTELSNSEILTALHFTDAIDNMEGDRKKKLQEAFQPIEDEFGTLTEAFSKTTFRYIYACNCTNIYYLPTYCLKLNFHIGYHPSPCLYYDSKLEMIPPRASVYAGNGHKRMVYQLGYINSKFEMHWVTVPTEKLQKHYHGKKKELPLCIQSHAYFRLFARMKPMYEIDVLWHLCNTLSDLLEIVSYKGHILIPFYCFEYKCGYFAGVIDQNRLIIKTFLFLTHHLTPEGDRLEEISGLSKEEISYWKIGTLENFVDTDHSSNSQIMEAFEKAGISHLFDVDPIMDDDMEHKNYNWDALSDYIRKGKEFLSEEETEDEMEELLNSLCHE